MKVLVLARGCPNAQDPIYGNFEYEQALTLSAIGVDIIFSFIDRRSRTSYQRKRGLMKHEGHPFPVYGGYLWPVFPFKYLPKLATYLYIKRYLKLCKHIIKKEGKPDLIHCHFLFNLPLAVAVGNRYGIPVIETEHWSDLKKQKMPFYIAHLSKYYSKVHTVIAVSESLKNTLKQQFSVESERIYNMVSNSYFELLPQKRSNVDCVEFISIGSLIFRKGFDLLIEALSGLEKESWHLRIIGEGARYEEYKNIIRKKKLEHRIDFCGKRDKNEIREMMQNSDVFVLASRAETFGVVYIEAMACGLPVIATKCGGPEEFVTPEIGILIEKEDVVELKNALKWMIYHYKDYDKLLIQKKCYEQFSSNIIASNYLNVYRNIIRNTNKNRGALVAG